MTFEQYLNETMENRSSDNSIMNRMIGLHNEVQKYMQMERGDDKKPSWNFIFSIATELVDYVKDNYKKLPDFDIYQRSYHKQIEKTLETLEEIKKKHGVTPKGIDAIYSAIHQDIIHPFLEHENEDDTRTFVRFR